MPKFLELSPEKHPIIGRTELVSFPKISIDLIDAKIDTGAYTSSIHCHSIEAIGDEVFCIFLDPNHPKYTGEKLNFKIKKRVKVRSSNGLQEERIMIKTKIEVMDEIFKVRLTLSDRSNMRYPVLIGRHFLKKKFIVDVTRKNQSL